MEQVVMSTAGREVSAVVSEDNPAVIRARRTAFVARFIVLRESKRTRAHRIIELMQWDDSLTADELAQKFREVFKNNGDKMGPVERDIRRALGHSKRSLNQFVREYNTRATLSFIDALFDYERSNSLLFGADEQPKPGGWRLPRELLRDKAKGTPDAKGVATKGAIAKKTVASEHVPSLIR